SATATIPFYVVPCRVVSASRGAAIFLRTPYGVDHSAASPRRIPDKCPEVSASRGAANFLRTPYDVDHSATSPRRMPDRCLEVSTSRGAAKLHEHLAVLTARPPLRNGLRRHFLSKWILPDGRASFKRNHQLSARF